MTPREKRTKSAASGSERKIEFDYKISKYTPFKFATSEGFRRFRVAACYDGELFLRRPPKRSYLCVDVCRLVVHSDFQKETKKNKKLESKIIFEFRFVEQLTRYGVTAFFVGGIATALRGIEFFLKVQNILCIHRVIEDTPRHEV